MDGVCLSPTSGARQSMSGASVGGGGSDKSPRKSATSGASAAASSAETVRRSKSQGSRRGERTLSKCYSMAIGAGQGSPEQLSSPPLHSSSTSNIPSAPLHSSVHPPPVSPNPATAGHASVASSAVSSSAHHLPSSNKSHILLLSRQYCSFGSNVTSNYNQPPSSGVCKKKSFKRQRTNKTYSYLFSFYISLAKLSFSHELLRTRKLLETKD